MRSLFIGVPTYRDFKALTVLSIVHALGSVKVPFLFDLVSLTYLPEARQRLVDNAIKTGASHLLMIDADMTFPHDTIPRLAAHQKPIVGVSYAERRFTPEGDRMSVEAPLDGVLQTEPYKVASVGGGVLLLDLDALKDLPSPWFDCQRLDDGKFLGEDTYFCRKARKHGFDVWCDPSIEVGHVGDYVY